VTGRNEETGGGLWKIQCKKGQEGWEGEALTKTKRSLGERRRNSQRGKGMRKRGSERAREERIKFCQKLRGSIFKRGWKFSRKSEGCAINSLSWGKVGEVMSRGTKGKEKPGKM
jgi:hypothetical protein